MRERKRVKLRVDLAAYDSRCRVGSLGWTAGPSDLGDRFVTVIYDSGARLPTLWGSVEILEAETAAEAVRQSKLDLKLAVMSLRQHQLTDKEIRQVLRDCLKEKNLWLKKPTTQEKAAKIAQ